jgi:hypothetical protein
MSKGGTMWDISMIGVSGALDMITPLQTATVSSASPKSERKLIYISDIISFFPQ